MTNELTTSQQKGVTITDRDLCVVAGPGSGKTRVLVERFANLVSSGATVLAPESKCIGLRMQFAAWHRAKT